MKKFKLNEICFNITDGTHSTVIDDKQSNYFLLSCKNIKDGKININANDRRINAETLNSLRKRTKMSLNDVVLTSVGTIGQSSYIKEDNPPFEFQRSVAILKPNPSYILSQFLHYYLISPTGQSNIQTRIKGAAQPCLFLNDIKNMEILIPDLEVQQHIVDTIGSVDDLIELNEQKILKLENILIDKFNNFYITKCNKIDKLGNIFKCLLGGTPNTSKPEFWDGSVNWINSGEVNNLRIYKPSKMITELGMNKSATKLLPKGTTVLAITGATLGQISLLEIDTCANQSVVGILENDSFGKEFIYPLMNYHIKDLISHQTGGAQPHINKDNIESLSIKLPFAEEYINYKNETRPLVELQSNLVLQNEKLKNIKERLLKKYFG